MLLLWFPLAYCQNTTASNPQDQLIGWQPENKHRGTWGLVVNCLTTIFACMWSIQHLNVPGPFSSDGKWSRLGRSIKLMALTILFPEFMVLHALFELMMAIEALQEMVKDKNRVVELPWWLPPRSIPSKLSKSMNSIWPRLRRLALSCCESRKDEEAQMTNHNMKDVNWTLAHCFLANMGGIRYQRDDASFPLTAFQIANTPDESFSKPEMTEDDIGERTKQDWFVKVIATLQFLHLALSLIVRTSQGVAFSQLETISVGFTVCGALIYLLYFYKPQSLQAYFVTEAQLAGPRRIGGNRQELLFKRKYDGFWDVLRNKRKADEETDSLSKTVVERIPNDNIPISQNQWAHPGIFLLALTSALFGALHAIAWNFEFPTLEEKIVWHIATIALAASPVAGLLLIPVAQLTVSSGDAHAFLGNCLRLVRESSWHLNKRNDKEAAQRVYKRLEAVYLERDTNADNAQVSYKDIFFADYTTVEVLRQIMEHLDPMGESGKTGDPDKAAWLNSIPNEFKSDFCNLVRIMKGKESKTLNVNAKTNVFPVKKWLPEWINNLVLYLTSALYVLARVSILAVGFSSLRRMPALVYENTPWTVYIPSVGSG
ncbi:hypothetical protein PG988_005881 [Apiospora saccharicola]